MDIQSEHRLIAGLRCRVLEVAGAPVETVADRGASPEAKFLVILNHGFGATGDDLVDLGAWLLESHDVLLTSCRFVFPEAPMDLSRMGMPGARAWWPINMAALAEINQTRDYDQLTRLTPEGLLPASQQLSDVVQELQSIYGVDGSRTVLGGFSQGAMCSTDVVLRHGLQPAMLVLFSGTLLCRDDWQLLATAHPGCDVFQSHGRQDTVLPFAPAAQLSQMLFDAGFRTEFHEFQGGHTIPMSILQQFSQALLTICQR